MEVCYDDTATTAFSASPAFATPSRRMSQAGELRLPAFEKMGQPTSSEYPAKEPRSAKLPSTSSPPSNERWLTGLPGQVTSWFWSAKATTAALRHACCDNCSVTDRRCIRLTPTC